jgi:predicted metal-dependent peptidase
MTEQEIKVMLEALRAARFRAIKNYPYLAPALTRLRILSNPTPACPTIAVDRWWRIYWNASFIARFTSNPLDLNTYNLEALAQLFVHEVHHLLRFHWSRQGNRNNELWNVATDCEINDDIDVSAVAPISKPQLPQAYSLTPNLSAEEYYEALKSQQQQSQQQQQEQGGQGGDGEGQDDGDDSGQQQQGQGSGQGKQQRGRKGKGGGRGRQQQSQGQQQNQGDGSGDDQNLNGQNDGQSGQQGNLNGDTTMDAHGSGASAQRGEWELDPNDPDEPGVENPEEVAKQTLREVVNMMRQQGVGCGELERLAEKVLTNKVPWEKVLRSTLNSIIAVIRHGQEDYSYNIPSRRQPPDPRVILPAMIGGRLTGLVVVDTSGSMGGKDLGAALRQVKDIVERAGVDVVVAAGDWDVQRVTEIKEQVKWRKLENVLVGGGGTSMPRVVKGALEKVKEARKQVGFVLILTDGETDWDGLEDLKLPVVVGVINNPSAAQRVPRRFKVVEIETRGV